MYLRSENHHPMNRKLIISGFVAAVVTIAVYITVLNNGFVNWDDGEYIYRNPHIRSLGPGFFRWAFTEYYASNWHPLTWLSHAMDYRFWGVNPSGHHFTSVLIHGMNACLVAVLTSQLVWRWREQKGLPELSWNENCAAAGFSALLFGLHPVHVESVAWVSERKDVLCAFFYFGSVILYLHGRKKEGRERTVSLLSSLIAFIFALMAKPMAVSVPVALVLLDAAYPGKERSRWAEKVPFFLASMLSMVITVRAQGSGEAVKTIAEYALDVRVINAVRSYASYLLCLIMPSGLSPFYPFPVSSSFVDAPFIGSLALGVAVTVGCIAAWMKGRRQYLLLWLFYIISLVPVIGIMQIGQQARADRYLYIPAVAFSVLFGATAASMLRSLQGRRKMLLIAALSALLIMLSVVTLRQIPIWRSSVSLWSRVIELYPGRSRAPYVGRGMAYLEMGRDNEALADCRNAFLLPADLDAGRSYLDAERCLGEAYHRTGDYQAEIAIYTDIHNQYPLYPDALNNRGLAYAAVGAHDRAAADFARIIAIDPSYVNAYYNAAWLSVLLKRPEEACHWLGEAISHGFVDAAYLDHDSEFNAIRQEPCYLTIRKSMITQ